MPHSGLAFAIAVGVALGSIIYYLLPSNWGPHPYDDGDPPNALGSSWILTSDHSSTLRNRRFQNGNCSICLVDFANVRNNLKMLACGHLFHDHCISQWIREKLECPNCRKPINPSRDLSTPK